MADRKYLIYIDILGFEALAVEIAQTKGISQRDVREHLIDIIRSRIEFIISRNKIIGNKYGESDDWILVSKSMDDIYTIILDILDHTTGYTDFEKIPLEIALGIGEYESNAKLSGKHLITEDATINFLKTKTIDCYRDWFKNNFNESPKSTFIIIDESLYNEFNKMDKNICSKIDYQRNGRNLALFSIDIEKFKHRGKIFRFLEEIGSKRPEYKEVDTLYIKPHGFDEIISIISKNNIVIIIGDPEIGKTYTSIKLLFEYYNQGLTPIFVSDEKEFTKYCEGAHELEGKAIYFEDPWGKVNFRFSENDLKNIGALILNAKRHNAKVIISSRERIFEEFDNRKETSENLWKLTKKLKIKFSYSEENLREMVQRYLDVFEPAWNEDNNLRNLIINSAGTKLRTPMSIRQFVEITKQMTDMKDILEGLERASEETRLTFSREIKERFYKRAYDDLVLLGLAYVEIPIKYALSLYQDMIFDLRESGYDLIQAKDFNDALNNYINKELEIAKDSIKYIHPSYKEAFSKSLSDNGKPNNISKKIFSRILLKLEEREILLLRKSIGY